MAEGSLSEPGLRVLFVDDSANVLSGLRRMLYAERDRWDVSFATCASDALELFAECPFDVVVTDMRMTGMDGSDLLMRIRDLNPATVRIVLSGQTDSASALKASSVAHQYLSKPTDAETLRHAVSRALELERRLGQPRLRSALGGLERLPSPSTTVRRLNAVVADPACDADSIVRIIEPDLGISAKLLQLVNSAFFTMPREVTSLREAVSYIGLENVRAIATSADVVRALGSGAYFDLLAGRLQAHSAGVVQLARHILPALGVPPTCTWGLSSMTSGSWPLRPLCQTPGDIWTIPAPGRGTWRRSGSYLVPPTPTLAPTSFAFGGCPMARSRSSRVTTTLARP